MKSVTAELRTSKGNLIYSRNVINICKIKRRVDDLRNNILDWKNSVENVQENNSCTKARWCEGHLLLLLKSGVQIWTLLRKQLIIK